MKFKEIFNKDVLKLHLNRVLKFGVVEEPYKFLDVDMGIEDKMYDMTVATSTTDKLYKGTFIQYDDNFFDGVLIDQNSLEENYIFGMLDGKKSEILMLKGKHEGVWLYELTTSTKIDIISRREFDSEASEMIKKKREYWMNGQMFGLVLATREKYQKKEVKVNCKK